LRRKNSGGETFALQSRVSWEVGKGPDRHGGCSKEKGIYPGNFFHLLHVFIDYKRSGCRRRGRKEGSHRGGGGEGKKGTSPPSFW